MKEHFLTLLRDRNTGLADFRNAALNLSLLVASDLAAQFSLSIHPVETLLGQAPGALLKERIVLVPILRAGLALLPPLMQLFPSAPIGFFGIRRDEKTALPLLYYENIPPLSPKDRILLLDPMLGTGGTAKLALRELCEMKADLSRTTLAGIVAAPEGILAVKKDFPQVKIYTLAVDEKLNSNKFIVPGLGDFGDRLFGTGLNERRYTR